MVHCAHCCSGKSDYVEPAKRAHIMAAPRGRGGRGGFGQNLCRPHDIFRQRKQNTSRPPSMHVDDFVAAEFKDITTPLGLLPPKRPPKSVPKPPTRGLFTGNRGRATFHNQTRFFTPPQPKGVLLSGTYHLQTDIKETHLSQYMVLLSLSQRVVCDPTMGRTAVLSGSLCCGQFIEKML